jgi:chorismate--pyruvate lyase
MSFKNRVAWRTKLLRSEESVPFVHWLRDRESLTARLQAGGVFAVQQLRQGLAVPTRDEATAMGIRRKQLAWVREVALLRDGKPLVFAHTILPYRPRGPMTGWLARLGKRSLGALLFSHAGFTRGVIQYKRLDHRHPLFHLATEAMQLAAAPPTTLWARRSRFTFRAQSVLVTEVFSPFLCCA